MKFSKLSMIAGFIIAFALIFELAAHADEDNELTILTFSQPVQVPGRILPAGTYEFVLANSQSNRDIVRIFNADGTADVNMTKQYRQLVFDVTRADNVATGVNNSTNVSCCRSIDSTSVQLRDQPEVDNGRQGWSFSNGVVTIGDTAFIVVGRLLLGRILSTDGEGHNGLVILARRSP